MEKAVKAWQLYNGSSGWVRPRDEQRLYDRALQATRRLAKVMGQPYGAVAQAIWDEVEKRGSIRPKVGQDI